MPDSRQLASLPDLGPKSARWLAQVGIITLADLRRTGSIGAFLAARSAGNPVSLNLLWALEGALTGQPWRQVAREHRTSLLLALDDAQRAINQGDRSP